MRVLSFSDKIYNILPGSKPNFLGAKTLPLLLSTLYLGAFILLFYAPKLTLQFLAFVFS